MSFDNVQALPPGTRLGDYRLDAMIGHGGFGITYRAFDTQLAKIVAIKEYLPLECAIRQADGEVVPRSARLADDFTWGRERFLDEARALARFRHPHIVPVLRYFEANGTAYTVMEFEDGKNVAELLHDPSRRLPTDDVRRLADGLLRGLGAVHAQGFLHRDIKPANIIIRRDSVPVLVDFGAARQALGGRTRSLTGVLTPQYAPIEQYALDSKQGPWSDIYSAAAVLYHAIAGQTPPDAAARVGKDPYRPLAETEGDRFEPAFLAAIDRAMAFAPDDRPQSVEEWSALFDLSPPKVQDAPTQRLAYAAGVEPPRLGGASRESTDPPVAPPTPRPRSRRRSAGARIWIVVVVMAALTLWRFQPEISTLLTGASRVDTAAPPAATAQSPSASPATTAQSPPAPPARRPASTPATQPPATPTPPALRHDLRHDSGGPPPRPRRRRRLRHGLPHRLRRPSRKRLQRRRRRIRRLRSRSRSRPSVRPPRRGRCSSVPTRQRGPRGRWRAKRASLRRRRPGRISSAPSGCHTIRGRATSVRLPTASARVSASPTSPMANARQAFGRPIN
jgi:serine/threonine protein kinase